MIALTPAMVEAMLSAPDLELATGSTAADMVASGWAYQEAMAAIAVAFGNQIREGRAAQRRRVRLADKARKREAIDARLDARRRGGRNA